MGLLGIVKVECFHNLTTDEHLHRSRALAGRVLAATHVKEEAKSVATEWKEKIREIEAEASDLVRIVESGQELRQTECQETLAADGSTVAITRLDTGEVVGSRRANEKDLQLSMAMAVDEKRGSKARGTDRDFSSLHLPADGSDG
ncbi:MAG: hypothetical protein ABJA67_06750 [Chthonomonadales bacterium]